jgi:hypothetical protein
VIFYLFDVNLLLALFDPGHEHHQIAHQWYGGKRSWASCAITENGFIRIASSPAYPGGVTSPAAVAEKLRGFIDASDHAFWEDRLSLLDGAVFRLDHIKSARQVTDVYLLGLAAQRGGKLATLDRTIPLDAVVGGQTALELVY